MLNEVIEKTIDRYFDEKWDAFYFAIDLHGVILKHSYDPRFNDDNEVIYEECIQPLQIFSNNKRIRLILFTSSYDDYTESFVKWFKDKYGVTFDYVNENPECGNSRTGDFTKKFYYNIILDDKAGFDPEKDWDVVLEAMIVFNLACQINGDF